MKLTNQSNLAKMQWNQVLQVQRKKLASIKIKYKRSNRWVDTALMTLIKGAKLGPKEIKLRGTAILVGLWCTLTHPKQLPGDWSRMQTKVSTLSKRVDTPQMTRIKGGN
jgi:expansin (peptidoglycan-binding protein)